MAEPRRRRKRGAPAVSAAPGNPPNSIVAAATRLNTAASRFGQTQIPKTAWGEEAWRQFDINPELRYGMTWLANSVSRCRIYVAELDDKGRPVKECDDAFILDLAAGFIADPGKMAALLHSQTTQLGVPGDSYCVVESRDAPFDTVYVVSIDEITQNGTESVTIDRGDGKPYALSLSSNIIFRVHRPHPRRAWEATSSVQAALPVLREMEELSKYILSVVNSKLSGPGIMGMPSEMSFPEPPQGSVAAGETAFSSTLGKAMMTGISDMSDPAAVVPIVVEGPGEHLKNIVWLTNPNGDLTETPATLRNIDMRRLATALDLPAEALNGNESLNRWNQWQIEEAAIKINIEPLLILIVHAYTAGFLRAALEAAEYDPKKYAFWFDSADLVLRPDRGTDAKDAYDRLELSGAAMRRELGFSEADAPVGDELRLRQLEKLAALAPGAIVELLPLIAGILGVELPEVPTTNPDGTPINPSRQTPQGSHEVRALPQSNTAVAASVAIHNALSKAGAMLAGRKADLKDVPRHLVHVNLGGVDEPEANRLLAGAFDHLEEMTDADTAGAAWSEAFRLLTTGEAL